MTDFRGDARVRGAGSGKTALIYPSLLATIAFTLTLLMILPTPIHAIPSVIDFQGKLADSGNNPQTGVFNMTFTIHNQSSAGPQLWMENKLISVSAGLFSTLLGSVNPINLSFNQDYYVEINVSGETFTPRYRVATVPYAFRANISEYAVAKDLSSPSFVITAISGQTRNLTEWRDSSGNTKGAVDAQGQFVGIFVGDGSQLTGVGLANTSKNMSAGNITADTFGVSVGGGDYTFPRNLAIISNLTVGSFVMFVSQFLGRVGINTLTPTATLDVNGTLNISNASGAIYTPTLCLNGDCQSSWAIGAQPAGWTLSGSNVYNNTPATGIGIGTSSPQAKLHVSGSALANNISVNFNDTFYLNITGRGRVGIRTSNPESFAALDVRGQTRVEAQNGGVAMWLVADNAGRGFIITNNTAAGGAGTANTSGFRIDLPTDYSDVYSVINGSTKGGILAFQYNSPGFVGIGTNNPSSKLDVSGTLTVEGINVTGRQVSDNTTLTNRQSADNTTQSNQIVSENTTQNNLISGNNNTLTAVLGQKLNLTGGTLSGKLNISGTDSTNNISFVINNTFYYNTSFGRVGIGTSSPNAELHIVGSLNVTGTSYLNNLNIAGLTTAAGEVNATQDLNVGRNLNVARNLTVSNNVFFVSNFTERVGIGTTVPGSKLDVQGTNIANNLSLNVNNFLYYNASSLRVGVGTSSPQVALQVGAGTDAISVGSLAVSNNGNAGFSVRDSSNDIEGFLFTGTSGADTGAILGSVTSHPLVLRTGNTNAIVIGTSQLINITNGLNVTAGGLNVISGSVGIGTSAPNQLLQVAGRANITNLTVHNLSAIANCDVKADAAGNVYCGIDSTSTSSNTSSSGDTGYIPKFVNATHIVSSPIFTDNTSIGIGTRNPTALLDVNGTASVASSLSVGSLTSAGNATILLNSTINGSDLGSNFLKITGTMPATLAAATYGVNIQITNTAELNDNNVQAALNAAILYSNQVGAVSAGGIFTNRIRFVDGGGSQTAPVAGPYSVGAVGYSGGSGTTSYASTGVAGIIDGSTSSGVGVLGKVTSTLAGSDKYGVIGSTTVTGADNAIGGFFSLGLKEPVSGGLRALEVDNGGVAADIFVARDNGTIVLKIADNGTVGIGNNFTSYPSALLDVQGTNVNNNLSLNVNNTLYVNGSTNRVGIGTTSPNAELHVVGNLNVTGTSYLNNLNIAGLTTAAGEVNATQDLNVGRNLNVARNLTVSNNVLFVSNLTERVGVGTNNPSSQLHVVGNITLPTDFFLGSGGTVNGGNSIAIGTSPQANGTSAIAIGNTAKALNTYAIAQGYTAFAQGDSSVAIGRETNASAASAIAFGYTADASASGAIAIGRSSDSLSASGVAIGDDANVESAGSSSIAIGTRSNSTAGSSISIGYESNSTASASIALGKWSASIATDTVAIGQGAKSLANYAIAQGSSAFAQGQDSIVIGRSANATQIDSIVIGRNGLSMGTTSNVVIGAGASSNYNSNAQTVVIGSGANASGQPDIAIGASAKTVGGIAIGYQSQTAGDNNPIAIGGSAQAMNQYSLAIGANAHSSGVYSLAIGHFANQLGSDAVVIGGHADGSGQDRTMAIGAYANVTSPDSTAIGYGANASGQYSIALGKYASATVANQFVVGNPNLRLNTVIHGTLTANGTLNVTNITLAPNCVDGQVLKWLNGVGQCGIDSGGSANATGSGATGYIAQFSNGTNLVNSPVFTNNVSVGLGTTTPTSTLHVVGTANITGGLNVTAGGFNVISGNVGIGTTAPSSQLHIVGNITLPTNFFIGSTGTVGGGNSIAIGTSPKANNSDAIAIGDLAKATSVGAVAIGYNTDTGLYGQEVAIGYSANASVVGVAIGRTAKGLNSGIAIGAESIANGTTGPVALGENTIAANTQSIAIGNSANTLGYDGIAIGGSSKASALSSVAIGRDTLSNSTYGLAIIESANALGAGSIAIGRSSNSTNTDSIALGNTAKALANYAIAQGSSAFAQGTDSIAIGRSANSTGTQGIAIGFGTFASINAVSLGVGAKGTGTQDIAIGESAFATSGGSGAALSIGAGGANASNTKAVALGYVAKASGDSSIAMGANSNALANYAIAQGTSAFAQGTDSIAIGRSANTTSTSDIAIGTSSIATAPGGVAGSIAIGKSAVATSSSSPSSIAIGSGAVATGAAASSTAIGYLANASGNSVAIGSNAFALGGSVVIGSSATDGNPATSGNSIIIGYGARGTGIYDMLAIGYQALAAERETVSLGYNTNAIGYGSTAIGWLANATGSSTVALGRNAYATSTSGIGIGYNANASGSSESIALGESANAGANYATAIGFGANATSADSVALGRNAVTTAANQFVVGGPNGKLDTKIYGSLNVTNITLSSNCPDGQVLKWLNGVGQCGSDSVGSGDGGGNASASGKTGYIAEFVNGTHLISSPIFTDNISVGIGTTSLASTLYVSGNAGSISIQDTRTTGPIGAPYLYFRDSSGSSWGNLHMGDNNTGEDRDSLYISSSGNENIYLQTTSAPNAIKIDNNGLIGVNTTTPTAKLDILGTNPVNNLSLNVNNVLYMNNSANRVGIGTSSPSSRLDVSGTLTVEGINVTGRQISDNTTIAGNLTTTNARIGNLETKQTADNTTIAGNLTATNTRIGNLETKQSADNTTLTNTKLSLTGGTLTGDLLIGTGGFAGGGMTLETDGDIWTNGTLYITGNITNVDITTLNVNGTITPAFDNLFDLGTSARRFRNGFFSSDLNLTGGSIFYRGLDINATKAAAGTCPGGQVVQNATSGTVQCIPLSAGNNVTGTGVTNYVAKWTSGVALGTGTIYDNGNVGIGTTSPSAGLQINSTNPTLRTNGSAFFDGNVGIGTTAPSSQLHVVGNITLPTNFWIGSGGTSTASNSLAIGTTAKSLEDSSIAIGPNSFTGVVPSSAGSVAIGSAANASGGASIAIGQNAKTDDSTNGQIAIGNSASALGTLSASATVIGSSAVSTGQSSVALGVSANVTGNGGIAIGGNTIGGQSSVTIGSGAQTDSANNIAIGISSRGISGQNNLVIGSNAFATANNGISIGNAANTTAADAIVIGATSFASGTRGIVIGKNANATHTDAIVIGQYATSTANNQFMVGGPNSKLNTIIHGTLNVTDGLNVTAGGLNVISGNVGIGTTAPTQALHVVGNINVTGSIYQSGADVAENIKSSGTLEAGDVVIIDETKEETVRKSYMAYDTRVAGVISTSPATLLGSDKGDVPLALSGRVPVKTTNENGSIKPGDLLTTSSKAGYAMKCGGDCRGSIIGKAMGNMNDKEGSVIVLLSLG